MGLPAINSTKKIYIYIPGDNSWHLVLSAIIHVFLGTLQEVFIILTLTELEHMLMYLPTNGYSLCISTSTKLEPHLTPSSEEELNHKPLNNESWFTFWCWGINYGLILTKYFFLSFGCINTLKLKIRKFPGGIKLN